MKKNKHYNNIKQLEQAADSKDPVTEGVFNIFA